MSPETRNCQSCTRAFPIEVEDLNFYERMKVPPPTFCPECRLVRRLAFRNERSLYKRKCDLCGEAKIMMFPEGTPFPVYCRTCWWSDQWSAAAYAREYDPSRTFFEQFRDLLHVVPRPGTIHQGNIVDSDYTNRVTDARSCYLSFGCTRIEYCRYVGFSNDAKECVDCYNVQKTERCYECVDCFQSYDLQYCQESSDCTNSYFLYNCRNLQNCFGCVNLRNKQYCIWNEQYSKEDYERALAGYQLGNALMLEGLKSKFAAFKRRFIVPALVTHHSENVSGNWIEGSKDVRRSFNARNLQEGAYVLNIFDEKDGMDHSFWGNNSEKVYECINVGIQAGNIRFGNECWAQAIDAEYVMNCHNARDIFGCVGIRSAEHCVLNKEYSKEDFEALTARIRADMDANPYKDAKDRTYRYGEFFPAEMSPHSFNETLAQDFFPLTRDGAAAEGYRWREEEGRNYQVTLPADKVPDAITEAAETTLQEIIGCAHEGTCNQKCTTAFRILPEDLGLYKAKNIPLPKLCPNCRHFERLARRNPLKLWSRRCQCAGAGSEQGDYANTGPTHTSHVREEHCPNDFETSYAPDRPEIVYCVDCYQNEVN